MLWGGMGQIQNKSVQGNISKKKFMHSNQSTQKIPAKTLPSPPNYFPEILGITHERRLGVKKSQDIE